MDHSAGWETAFTTQGPPFFFKSNRRFQMSSDYKYDMQMIAEELAEERYGKDFYDLPDEVQYRLYDEAMNQYVERRIP
jgi:hypothetical protein